MHVTTGLLNEEYNRQEKQQQPQQEKWKLVKAVAELVSKKQKCERDW